MGAAKERLRIGLLGMAAAMLLQTSLSAGALPIPDGRRIRVIVDEQYPDGNVYIGGTTGWNKRPGGSGEAMDREFSYVTPENDFKHATINPSPGVWNWELGDAWVKLCAEENQVLRLHSPISPQASRWAREDDRTAEELEKSMTEFMTKLCQRYDQYPHVKWIDVVNETVSREGEWFGPRPGTDKWENPWPKMGYDDSHRLKPPRYIKLAFEIATKHAPNTKLIVNQHGGMEGPAWNKIKKLVKYLRDQGLRVDGIGWQAHVNLGFEKEGNNMKRLSALIDWAHANQLSFHVTENNVWLRGEKDYQAQAETFGAILKALLEKRHTGIVTWNVWNLSDGDPWSEMKAFDGSIFFRDYQAKPAYYALQKLLENPPATK